MQWDVAFCHLLFGGGPLLSHILMRLPLSRIVYRVVVVPVLVLPLLFV